MGEFDVCRTRSATTVTCMSCADQRGAARIRGDQQQQSIRRQARDLGRARLGRVLTLDGMRSVPPIPEATRVGSTKKFFSAASTRSSG